MHEQEPTPLRSLQIVFAPHGEGLHGWEGSSIIVGSTAQETNNRKSKKKVSNKKNFQRIIKNQILKLLLVSTFSYLAK